MPDLNFRVDLDDARQINALTGLSIRGVEVTQSVQFFDSASHLSDSKDFQRDNTLRLVMGKPTLVRVYLSAGMFSGSITDVTGTLELYKRPVLTGNSPFLSLTPQAPGSATAYAYNALTYDQWRRSLGRTLNFVIPPRKLGAFVLGDTSFERVCGNFLCKITITAPDGRTARTELSIDLTLHQQLRMAGIMLRYDGPPVVMPPPGTPNLTLPAPTVNDLRTTVAGIALRVYPISAARYRTITPAWPQDVPLSDAVAATNPGGCSPNWLTLLGRLQGERTLDGNRANTVYYGLLPLSTPVGTTAGTNSGCGDDGVGAGRVNDALTMAHEMGHACGLSHAPCGTSGALVDASFPAYKPYAQGSTGEYGVDVSSNVVLSPENTRDLMGYCTSNPQWVSPYHYDQFLISTHLEGTYPCPKDDRFDLDDYYVPKRFDRRWLPDPPPERLFWDDYADPAPVISIIGIVHSEREIEVSSVVRLHANPQVNNGRETELRAVLLNEHGGVAARGAVYRLRHSGGGCGCGCEDDEQPAFPYSFQAFISDTERGSLLQIVREDNEVWSRRPSAEPPRVGGLHAGIIQTDQFASGLGLALEFGYESMGDVRPEGWLQWSNDDGRNWFALTTGLYEHQALVNAGSLPAGSLLLRLFISDGFDTAVFEPIRIEVPQRAPETAIFSPRQGEPFQTGAAMRLWGSVISASGDELDEDHAIWLLDGQEIAQGTDMFITVPDEGEHTVTLVGRDDYGSTEQRVTFTAHNLDRE